MRSPWPWPLCTCSPSPLFSNDLLPYNLQNLTEVWAPIGKLSHLFLSTFSSFHSHSSFGFSKYPRGASQQWQVVIYLSPILNTAFSGVSTCQAFILCIPVPGTGHSWFPQCCWMQNGCILAFHSCTVISSMMSTWDFRICLIPHK